MAVKYTGLVDDGAKLQCHAAGSIYGRIPLPEDVKIIPPAPDVQKEMAKLSGYWFGIWAGGFTNPALLAVERIDGSAAQVVYALLIAPKWWRYNATNQNGVLKWVSADTGNWVTLQLLPDGTLNGEYFSEKLGRVIATITMTKQEDRK